MDVLKEIQQAEEKARAIGREYDGKAKSLAAATAGELERLRAAREAALEAELAALQGKRNHLLLDRRRCDIPHLVEGTQDVGSKPEFSKSRQCLSSSF